MYNGCTFENVYCMNQHLYECHVSVIAHTLLCFCSLGAAIVVDSLYIPPLFSELLYNPLCMLLLEDRTLSLNELEPSQACNIQYVYGK